jgi:hypothetical protein
MSRRTRLLITGCLFTTMLVSPARGASFGNFIGEVIARWLVDGRKMELTADFAYLDPSGRRWNAPKGSIVDGASIPQVFWTVVGGPFEGSYRNASVVHDVACVKKEGHWQDVHRMFYYAMRAGGVSDFRAAVMYAAVYRFGPRWEERRGFWGTVGGGLSKVFGVLIPDDGVPPPPPPAAAATEENVRALEALVEKNKPTSPEEVERLLAQ